MVARGKGKKAPASEAVATVSNGDVISQENEAVGSSVGVSVAPPAKKGRARGTKKEIKEEVDETPPVAAVEITEKPAKSTKASKSSKKVSKGKGAAKNEVEDEEVPLDGVKEENDAPLVEVKPAVVEKKAQGRKRKADSAEKVEEPAPVSKKLPKTKTKAAKKETVDEAGIPEDPSAVAAVEAVVESQAAQTNGAKKSSTSRKRSAPKAEEPIADPIAIPIEEPPTAKKNPKSKESKKETNKAATKSRASKKSANDEDATEDDILPEDEFIPEEEEEEPKVKKSVRSKGSRKQLKEDIPLPEEVVKEIEPIPEKVTEKEKKITKAKKSAEKKEIVKKVPTKRGAKKEKELKDEANEVSNGEQSTADVEPSEGNTNGTVKPKAAQAETKPAARGRKRAAATPIEEADETDGSKSTHAKPEAFINPTVTEYSASDFTLDKSYKLKISSWNIAGLRSWLKKDGLQYMEYEKPDILCLQEIKCTTDQLPEEARIPGYHPYWLCMPGGHAGVAVYSKIMPIHVEYGIGNDEHDDAGRMITAEYEKFYLICVYVPNSGRKLVNLEKRMQWEALFREYVQRLDKIKPVIIAGDMNVSHTEIDLANPKTNTKNAGFTPQERDAMTKLFELGYVDTFRHFYPEQTGAYSFWSYMGKARSKNVGWRLDYFIVSERITSKVVESAIRAQVLGSDHCPITLFLNI